MPTRRFSPLLVPALLLAACASPSSTPETAASAAPSAAPSADAPRVAWAIAIHGGAGVIPKTMEEAEKQAYFDALEDALGTGRDLLAAGASALDVVEQVVTRLEDSPQFNAGKGAVFTHDGRNELDAAIMDGATLNCGAVAGVRTVRNPITLARKVMEESRHVLFVGDGAEAFADEVGVARVEPEYFFVERRWEQLQAVLDKEKAEASGGDGADLADLSDPAAPNEDWAASKYGTVGVVVLDQAGDLAAGTSTGGMTNKRFGRVGDVPIIGAGTYANNKTAAISCTGFGEQFIRHTVAHDVSALMEYRGLSVEAAAREVIDGKLDPGDGGLIAVSHTGEIALVFNSPGMFRGAADAAGRFEVAIWEEGE